VSIVTSLLVSDGSKLGGASRSLEMVEGVIEGIALQLAFVD
jgi:hypothetical protein